MNIDLTKSLYFDGGMGSLLMERGNRPIGYRLEKLNYESPEIVKSVHEDYFMVGSNIATTNTFGANRYKFSNKDELKKIIDCGIELAKETALKHNGYTLLDIGSLGKLIGAGGITFDEAYEAFKEVVLLAQDRTDGILVETITNLIEMRACILAVKENSKLPLLCSMSFEQNGKTVFGTPVDVFCIVAKGLGADAVGANCTLSPKQMLSVAKQFVTSTDLPIFIQPNACMPKIEKGKTFYDTTPIQYATDMLEIKKLGINILGGCCGTTPDFIKETIHLTQNVFTQREKYENKSVVCSAYKSVIVDGNKIVGERINPTGKKRFQEALKTGEISYILQQGLEQEENGADILDVNVGINGIDETETMIKVITSLQEVTSLPLQIDSSNIDTIEKALRYYHGKALVNSVNGKDEVLDRLLPIVKKYGASVVGLTIDEEGISKDADKRLKIATKIISRCEELGIDKDDIYIDTLTMAEASEKGNAICTLDTLKKVKGLGVKSILGISNISFGMPMRMDINAKFLEMAFEGGLDLAIINPNLKGVKGSKFAENFLLAKENSVDAFIEYATQNEQTQKQVESKSDKTLFDAILSGQKELAEKLTKELLENTPPLEVANTYIIPALDEVGKRYDAQKIFLPQLIASAESAKSAFIQIENKLPEDSKLNNKKFILCTVKGDIHDIGKNIVKAVVGNYGFKTIDLGKDVDYEVVLQSVRENYPCVLGLSALMTTTVNNMEETIKIVRKEFPDIKIVVGGAVLTPEYAKQIGGIYCLDANDTVKQLKNIFEGEK